MNIIEISNQELINFLSNKKNCYDYGAFGILFKYDNSTLLKIYYEDIFNTYTTLDSNKLDQEIINIDINKLDQLKKIYTTLKKTKSNSLIKGIITYKGYPIGILLEYYKNYLKLSVTYEKLNPNDKIKVLSNIKELLNNLFENNIYPTDIKEDNILINPDNLDIKLIDLDGIETQIKNNEYIKKCPHIKNYCMEKYYKMSIRLLKK